MSEESKPMAWESVAVVAFTNNQPVIISSIEPLSIFHTLRELMRSDCIDESLPKELIDDEEFWSEFDDHLTLPEMIDRIQELRWELYPVEMAKEIFCSRYGKEEEDKSASNKPLPGQLSMPFPDEE